MGPRSDFTVVNRTDGAGVYYDTDALPGFDRTLKDLKRHSTKAGVTFGSSYKVFDKVYYPNVGKTPYFGRGTETSNGVGLEELKNADKHTRPIIARYTEFKDKRDITFSLVSKEQRTAQNRGPGAYHSPRGDMGTPKALQQFLPKNGFGSAKRDIFIGAYGSTHSVAIKKGLY
jgi:hypothetical protein